MISPINKIRKIVAHVFGTGRTLAKMYGFDLRRLIVAVGNTYRFLRDVSVYRRMQMTKKGGPAKRFPLRWRNLSPQLVDFEDSAGSLGGSYFFQDLWAARKIYQTRPAHHVDIGSRIDGFVSHLLVFMEVTLVDIRELESQTIGLNFVRTDATSLEIFDDNSQASISSLHAAEHFGLGRYGDPIDPNACFQFMENLQRVLKPGGRLYLSVPIGQERLLFNAQRVFSPITVLEALDQLSLVSFAAVDRSGKFVESANPADYFSKKFAFGFFELTKA